jgi:glutaminase
MINKQKVLDEIYDEVQQYIGQGEVANYIPALSKVPKNQFAMALRTNNGEEFFIGDYKKNFSIQSISKLFVLTMAMSHTDSDRWERVGREPSGTAFNSLVQLERENGKPRNPFINAGAIVMTDYLFDFYKNPKDGILEFIQQQSGNNSLSICNDVFACEKQTGQRNYALAHFMKSYGNITHDIEDVLSTYFYHCSIEMNCLDLVRSTSYLVNCGMGQNGKKVIDHSKVRRINALMLTCGPYDDAGEFAFKIGLPTKSGVGGGIVGVFPGKYSVAVWSPALNSAGNSFAGTKALELLTTKLDESIF